MITVDDLRRSLDDRAATASDGAGMAERARLGAQRIKRRRAIGAVVAVCLLAVAVTFVPAALSRRHGPPPASIPFYRAPGQMTLSGAPDPEFTWSTGTEGTTQFMTALSTTKQDFNECCAEVRVHDPGTYDSHQLRAGQPITVAGHSGFRAMTRAVQSNAAPDGPSGAPVIGHPVYRQALTVGWQDASGAWVTVLDSGYLTGDRVPPDRVPLLLHVAADVRLTPPQDVLVPVHFSHPPGGRTVTFVQTSDVASNHPSVSMGLGATSATALPLSRPSARDMDQPLQIRAGNAADWNWSGPTYGAVNTTVAGHPARYYEYADNEGSVSLNPGSSILLMVAGTCGVQVDVRDSQVITRADLEKMFTGATFDRCDGTKTWRPFD